MFKNKDIFSVHYYEKALKLKCENCGDTYTAHLPGLGCPRDNSTLEEVHRYFVLEGYELDGTLRKPG